jgi:hypothetical protein
MVKVVTVAVADVTIAVVDVTVVVAVRLLVLSDCWCCQDCLAFCMHKHLPFPSPKSHLSLVFIGSGQWIILQPVVPSEWSL